MGPGAERCTLKDEPSSPFRRVAGNSQAFASAAAQAGGGQAAAQAVAQALAMGGGASSASAQAAASAISGGGANANAAATAWTQVGQARLLCRDCAVAGRWLCLIVTDTPTASPSSSALLRCSTSTCWMATSPCCRASPRPSAPTGSPPPTPWPPRSGDCDRVPLPCSCPCWCSAAPKLLLPYRPAAGLPDSAVSQA